jgi:8-oxo-dGTP pyrophosphatase MutT (NUDIX family)
MSDVTPVPAASVILLRGDPFEVLMIHRHAKSSFAPNAWVFPGGAVDAGDERGSTLETMRVAAARELFEESGIWMGAPLADREAKRRALLAGETTFDALAAESPVDFERLVWTSRWITPEGVHKRFDTWFFLARANDVAEATVDDNEAVDVVWIAPADAINNLEIVFPTQKNLEAIAGFTSIEALLESRRGATITPTQPRLLMVGGKRTIVLP